MVMRVGAKRAGGFFRFSLFVFVLLRLVNIVAFFIDNLGAAGGASTPH